MCYRTTFQNARCICNLLIAHSRTQVISSQKHTISTKPSVLVPIPICNVWHFSLSESWLYYLYLCHFLVTTCSFVSLYCHLATLRGYCKSYCLSSLCLYLCSALLCSTITLMMVPEKVPKRWVLLKISALGYRLLMSSTICIPSHSKLFINCSFIVNATTSWLLNSLQPGSCWHC